MPQTHVVDCVVAVSFRCSVHGGVSSERYGLAVPSKVIGPSPLGSC